MINNISHKETLRYLGIPQNEADQDICDCINKCEKLLLSKISPKYTYKLFELEKRDNKLFAGDIELVGNDIANHLDSCHHVIFFAATLSIEADKIIQSFMMRSKMTEAIVMDSLASTAIEQICDKAQYEIKKHIIEINNSNDKLYFTWRYSPGYGDLPLDLNYSISVVLNTAKIIGLTITESSLLNPLKSVTALIGISSEPLPVQRTGCAFCNLRDTCQYRLSGNNCDNIR